jgi:hypothetical protein
MPELPAARTLPEFMRSLRGFAAVHALGDRNHDRVFVPFVEARRAAHRARLLSEQLRAFDGSTLTLALQTAIAEIATDRWPASLPDRRAMEAFLTDAARPVFDALARCDRAARWLSGAGDADRDGCWNGWVDALAAIFRALDTFWSAVQPTVAPFPERLRAPLKAPTTPVVTE